MKMCYICGRESVIQDFVWKNGKCILVDVVTHIVKHIIHILCGDGNKSIHGIFRL